MERKKKERDFSIYILGLITILAYRFFDYSTFSDSAPIKMISFILVLAVFVYSYRSFVTDKSNKLSKNVRWIVLSIIVSMFSSWVFWGQSLVLSYRIAYQVLLYIVFFYLVKEKTPIRKMEYFILFFGLLYSLLWLYALLHFPTPIFGAVEDNGLVKEDDTRGMLRINFVGIAHLVLAYFFCLVKFNAKRNNFYLLGVFYFFIFIIFQLTRQVIAFSFIVGIVYYFYNNRKKIVLYGVISVVVLTIGIKCLPKENVLFAMIEVTQEQSERSKNKDKDIRLKEYEFFFTDYSKNAVTMLLGNGVPHTEGNYGEYANYLAKRYGYYLSDVGYAYIYCVMGIVGLLLFFGLIIRTLKMKIPPDYYYCKLYVIYMVFVNIASDAFLNRCNIICLCVCLYIMGTPACKVLPNPKQHV